MNISQLIIDRSRELPPLRPRASPEAALHIERIQRDWKGASTQAGFRLMAAVVTESARDVKRRERYAQHVLPEIAALLRVARSMTPQASDAEDLVQDTLLRAWRSLESFEGRHPRAWLLTIELPGW